MLPVFRFETLDSTNLEARRIWEEGKGPEKGFYVTARTQTAGRGRMGREWLSPPGGLWVTLARPIEPDPRRYQGVSLVAGLAASAAVEKTTGLFCEVKWPNDLLADGRKLCGILCEMILGLPAPVLLVGIGINANFHAALLGNDLLHPATTILDRTGKLTDLAKLQANLAKELEAGLALMDEEGLPPFLPPLEERLAHMGEVVEIHLPGGKARIGVFKGVDSQGRAVLKTAHGPETFLTGDLLPPHSSTP